MNWIKASSERAKRYTSRMLSLFRESLPTPIGKLLVVTDGDDVLRAADFEECEVRLHKLLRIHYQEVGLTDRTRASSAALAIEQYFAGDVSRLALIRWKTGGTSFQRSVWQKLTEIPVGTTSTYGALARELTSPQASRAVGLANGSNPISVVIPCHRLVGANGALTGYAGGLHRKEWLLRHEHAR